MIDLSCCSTVCRNMLYHTALTHWGRVMYIYVSKLTIIGSDNGLSPGRRQAVILNNAGILLIGPLETNFREILIEILTFPFKKMNLKVSSANWWLFLSQPQRVKMAVHPSIHIYLRLGCCPCPIWWGWQSSHKRKSFGNHFFRQGYVLSYD